MDFTKLSEFMDFLTGWRIPGCNCVVYKDRRRVFSYSSGFADVEAQRPMKGDETMFVFSATKPVVCTAALTLWERGLFLLDEPLEKYLPEWADVKVRRTGEDGSEVLDAPKRAVLIRDLFTMSAGLDYNAETPIMRAAIEKYSPECQTRDIVRALASEPLHFDPGTHWNYSLCHDVLGALVEVISGKKLRDYVRETIFEPVGMKDSSFAMTDEQRARMAVLYEFSDTTVSYFRRGNQNNFFVFGSEYDSGGAGMISTVGDMSLFAEMMSAGGVTRDGKRILSRSTINMMRRNNLSDTQLTDYCWDTLVGYGYGLGVRTLMSPATAGASAPVGEFGWTGAAGAYMLIDPDNSLAAFYAHHMLNNQEYFTAPRLRNIIYSCLD